MKDNTGLLKGIFRVFQYFLCLVITVITVYPFLFIVMTSFKTQKEYFGSAWGIPSSFCLDNFRLVLTGDFLRYFLNSIIVCVSAVFLVVVCSTMVSFAISKLRFKGAGLLFAVIMVGMMIPVHTTLIPIYVISKDLDIYNHLIALIGPYVSFSIPISTVIITQFFMDIPHEIEEAAIIDGCGPFSLYGRVIMPLAKPAVSTVVIYDILHTWNEFIYAMTLVDSKERMTLPVGLKNFYGEAAVNIPAIMCAVFISSLPVIIAYFSAQEQISNGLTQGAVKG